MRKRSIAPALTVILCLPAITAQQHIENVVILSGRVTMEDGSPPPALVTIERVCQSQVFREGYTDPKGSFMVRIGQDATLAIEDAASRGVDSRGRQRDDPLQSGGLTGRTERFSSIKNQGAVDLFGCEIRAQLDGYRAQPVVLGRRSIFDSPDLGTIVLHPIEGVTGATVSALSLAAPKAAQKAYEKAANEWQGGRPNLDKCARELQKAVEAYPRFAEAWALLGQTLLAKNDLYGAYDAYVQAVEHDPQWMGPYTPLIELSIQGGDWQGARRYAADYLQLNPHNAKIQFYLALASYHTGAIEAAEEALAKAEAQPDPTQLPQRLHLKGMILAAKGRYRQAAEAYRALLEAAPESPAAGDVRQQLEEWKSLGVISQ